MMLKGLIHIYCGDGKGKTTAAIGLAVRCAGGGGRVLFVSFLKDNKWRFFCAMKKSCCAFLQDGIKDDKILPRYWQMYKNYSIIIMPNQLNNISKGYFYL